MSNYSSTVYDIQRRSIYDKKSKYVDIGINGKLFPSWLMANFKQYKLPKSINSDDDPCSNPNKEDNKNNSTPEFRLKLYQEFIGKYLDANSPYRNILIYHGLGVGKTASAINVYNVLYSNNNNWNVYILLKASLKQGWIDELQKWLSKDDYNARFKNIIFIHYDSPNAEKNFLDARKSADISKKSLYIIDEAHNFIRNVFGNISGGSGKRAKRIYDLIIQDKTDSPDTRTILISGTPAINKPFELGLLFNLLRPEIFPDTETKFNRLFLKTEGRIDKINKNNINLFQRRILGLVSYYMASPKGVYASKTVYEIDSPMSDYHESIYSVFEDIEEKIAAKAKSRGKSSSQTYRSYTRQASNFVFPPISQTITGEMRPRPSKFRISEKDAMKFIEGDFKVDEFNRVLDTSGYTGALKSYIMGIKDYLKSKNDDDKKSKHTILNDLKSFIEEYKGNFKEFIDNIDNKKSKLFDAMYMCSSKMVNIIFNIMNSKGPTIVYSNYVYMEGLEVFKIYLSFFDFYNYMDTKELIKDRLGYVEFHGGIKDMIERKKGMIEFNKKENRYGDFIKIILISPAGSEGLNLRNVRQIHIMEPYWNEVRITQIIGRGIRQCSHSDLPIEERKIDIYRYKSVRKNGSKPTTDQLIEELAMGKEDLINSFLNSVREVAVDCELFKDQNMEDNIRNYKCFKFKEKSLFDKNIGPAYKKDIIDDIEYNDGLNDPDSMTVRVKVMKIKAVVLLSKPGEEPTFSQTKFYWWYDKSGTIYDFDLHFPVGKIATMDDGSVIKIDKDTYLISQLAIPMISSE